MLHIRIQTQGWAAFRLGSLTRENASSVGDQRPSCPSGTGEDTKGNLR